MYKLHLVKVTTKRRMSKIHKKMPRGLWRTLMEVKSDRILNRLISRKVFEKYWVLHFQEGTIGRGGNGLRCCLQMTFLTSFLALK